MTYREEAETDGSYELADGHCGWHGCEFGVDFVAPMLYWSASMQVPVAVCVCRLLCGYHVQ